MNYRRKVEKNPRKIEQWQMLVRIILNIYANVFSIPSMLLYKYEQLLQIETLSIATDSNY